MTGGNRLGNARAEAALGDEALKAAQALLGIELHDDTVSRAYYAALAVALARPSRTLEHHVAEVDRRLRERRDVDDARGRAGDELRELSVRASKKLER